MKVFVGLSGGVDSAVTAYLLREKGYHVECIFMKNWEDDDDQYCQSEKDLTDAKQICSKLGIKLHTVNFSKSYKELVFNRCLDVFANGNTPNPDILCNQEIKFKLLFDHIQTLGGDYLATGHYARIDTTDGIPKLMKARDESKDQTYFLYTLPPTLLNKLFLPLGDYLKKEVRAIAKEQGFCNYDKKDSTGICFIGERPFKQFLKTYLLPKVGPIKDTQGVEIGQHEGLMYYTLGQRSGIQIGGKKGYLEKPWYVVDKDIEKNTLIVAQGNDHAKLYSDTLISENHHWILIPQFPLSCHAKIRYRQKNEPCVVNQIAKDRLEVKFQNLQRSITPGQAIVFYQNDYCLGGGTITIRI